MSSNRASNKHTQIAGVIDWVVRPALDMSQGRLFHVMTSGKLFTHTYPLLSPITKSYMVLQCSG